VASSSLSENVKKSFVLRRAQLLDDYGGPIAEFVSLVLFVLIFINHSRLCSLRSAERDRIRASTYTRKRLMEDEFVDSTIPSFSP
jgi:hypothetical protein